MINYNQKRILVTGGAGFLGSHLCDSLLNKGHNVICVDNFYTGQKSNILHLIENQNFELIRHDITFPLYLEIDEIYNLIGKNIEAKDMEYRVLAILAFLEHQKGNKELAKEYLSRAKNNGFSRGSFQSNITNKDLREKTIKGLLENDSLE